MGERAGSEDNLGLIERLADRIERWGLVAPATLFLATMKPLSFFGGQMLYLAQPVLGRTAAEYAGLLEDPGSIDRLLAHLESLRAGAPERGD